MPRTKRLPLLLILLALVVSASSAALAATAQAASNQITIFQDDPYVLGNPTGTLDQLRSLGATYVRVFLGWASVAPNPNSRRVPRFNATDPSAYAASGWAGYDAVDRAAAARGMGVDFVITGTAPLWATGHAPRGVTSRAAHNWEPSAAQFNRFVAAVGRRYSGSFTPRGASSPLPAVRFWSIWNEPNYGYNLAPQGIGGVPVAPFYYRNLLDAGWAALHATGHARDRILIGETAPRGGNNPGLVNGTVPLFFLRTVYCVDARFRQLRGNAAAQRGCPTNAAGSRRFRAQNPVLFNAGGYGAHLYTSGQDTSPNVADPHNEPDYGGLTDLSNLGRTLDRLNRAYGSDTRLPIYNTEFGFQTNPPRPSCGCVFLSPATAAYYLNWSEYIEWSNSRVRSDSQYLLVDAPGPGGHYTSESGFSSGLEFLNGSEKADYQAFELPLYLPSTSTRAGRALQVWGMVRPAPYARSDSGLPQQVQIEFQPASGGPFRTLTTATVTNSSGYFRVPVTFPSSGNVMLQWSYPGNFMFLPGNVPHVISSRVQAIKIH